MAVDEIKVPEGTQPNIIETLKAEIATLKQSDIERSAREETLNSRVEELGSRNETLQESLDSALEEMTLRGNQPAANPGGEGEEGEEGKLKVEGKKVDVETEIEKSIREEEDFRTEQQKNIEDILVREEARDLEFELNQAIAKYPNASREEILLGLEDMSDEEAETVDIPELVQISHEKHSIEINDLKTKIEGDYKTQLEKEAEGGISVQQSSGAPSAPKAPAAPGAPPAHSRLSQDSEWGGALEKAKVEGARA